MAEFVLVLSCGHTVPDDSRYRQSVYCPRHMQAMEVAERNAGYSYRCYSCPAHGRYGLAKLTAEHKMSAHLQRFPTHKACVKLGDKVIETAGFSSEPELPFYQISLDDAPPF